MHFKNGVMWGFGVAAALLGGLGVHGVLAGNSDAPARGDPGKVTLVNDPENVVASELMGKWYPHSGVTMMLGGNAESNFESIEFAEDKAGFERIKKGFESALEKAEKKEPGSTDKPAAAPIKEALRSAYLSGAMTLVMNGETVKFDFVLVALRGNPHVFFYDAEKEDFESVNVMLARDDEGDKDLLFVGGDFNNQRFEAFSRVKPQADDGDAGGEKAAGEAKPSEGGK